jgi:hypothetical protein
VDATTAVVDATTAVVDATTATDGTDAADAAPEAADAGTDSGPPVTCSANEIICGDACIDPAIDRRFCGATAGCGADAGSAGVACDPGMVCNAGTCQADCGANLTKCGDSCVDTQHDPMHCGDCATQCVLANGVNVCNAGTCAVLSCQSGFDRCPAVWSNLPITSCSALASDTQNCGSCGNQCNVANATPTCASGSCAIGSCNAGFIDCDNDPSDGCETQGASCPTPKKVFITSTTYSANLGGYAGADARCAAAASGANLTGTFYAWIADGATTPKTHFTQSTIPYALVDGTIIANNFDGLTSGRIRHPIDMTETGAAAPAPTIAGTCNAWTGLNAHGDTQYGDCSGWTSTGSTGGSGNSREKGGAWSSQCSGGICGNVAALYCFEQ